MGKDQGLSRPPTPWPNTPPSTKKTWMAWTSPPTGDRGLHRTRNVQWLSRNRPPAGAGHPGADGKDDREDPWHRDTHGLRHDAVLRRCPDPNPIGAEFEEQPERADDRGREQRDHQPVPGIVEVEERKVAGERLLD